MGRERKDGMDEKSTASKGEGKREGEKRWIEG
jgi:hypothetical protein